MFVSIKFLSKYKLTLKEMNAEYAITDGPLQPATKAQRGYIHGLYSKLDINEKTLDVPVKELTLEEASDLIEELKYATENKDFGIYYTDSLF